MSPDSGFLPARPCSVNQLANQLESRLSALSGNVQARDAEVRGERGATPAVSPIPHVSFPPGFTSSPAIPFGLLPSLRGSVPHQHRLRHSHLFLSVPAFHVVPPPSSVFPSHAPPLNKHLSCPSLPIP